ncbi:hypothetical protein [Pantoea sp. RIT-PI-b]|nr:hypothetical protein [Pantoea sp. RIT-PI-b]
MAREMRVEDSTAKRKKPADKALLAVKMHPTQKEVPRWQNRWQSAIHY